MSSAGGIGKLKSCCLRSKTDTDRADQQSDSKRPERTKADFASAFRCVVRTGGGVGDDVERFAQ